MKSVKKLCIIYNEHLVRGNIAVILIVNSINICIHNSKIIFYAFEWSYGTESCGYGSEAQLVSL